MKKCWSWVLALSFALFGAGCATRTPMSFADDEEKLTDKSKPVLLMSATIKNTYKSHQPRLQVVHVEKPGAANASDRLNFVMDGKGRDESNDASMGSRYLIRMELDPGQYEIRGMSSMVHSFPIISSFFTPMHSALDVEGAGVIYIGHVEATVRERQGDEFRAGPVIPLLDQALSGASGGTFDVTISDAFAGDEALFRDRFPALKDVPIAKRILAPFDKAKAQAWWEKH